MTRQERVKKYMEILNKYDEGNSFYNWDILDSLSDEELSDEYRVLEKIHIIREHQKRIDNNPNVYSEEIMEYVRQRLGLEKYDCSRDKEINLMSSDEVLDHVCNWNGLLGYTDTIKSWIRDIYDINLLKRT